MDGVLLVDKPAGKTSHDVVATVRRELGGKQGPKVGHAGTLDPFATGLLLVLVGRATRVQRFLMALPKTYRAVARLGDSYLARKGFLPPVLVARLRHYFATYKLSPGDEGGSPVKGYLDTLARLVSTAVLFFSRRRDAAPLTRSSPARAPDRVERDAAAPLERMDLGVGLHEPDAGLVEIGILLGQLDDLLVQVDADDFLRAVTVKLFRRFIPTGDISVKINGDNGILRRFDNRGEEVPHTLRTARLGDVFDERE